MKIKKYVQKIVNIEINDERPECCGRCEQTDEDYDFCSEYNTVLEKEHTAAEYGLNESYWVLRCKQCMDFFGIK